LKLPQSWADAENLKTINDQVYKFLLGTETVVAVELFTTSFRDALKNAIGPTISGSNGVVFRIVLELMTPSQCDIRLLA
jgi:hypothetical protein